MDEERLLDLVTDFADVFQALPHCMWSAPGVLVVARPRVDGRLRVRSAAGQGGDPSLGLAAGVGRALRAEGHPVTGADLYIAGRSSAGSLGRAVAAAINDLFALGLPPDELARVARRAENEFVRVKRSGRP